MRSTCLNLLSSITIVTILTLAVGEKLKKTIVRLVLMILSIAIAEFDPFRAYSFVNVILRCSGFSGTHFTNLLKTPLAYSRSELNSLLTYARSTFTTKHYIKMLFSITWNSCLVTTTINNYTSCTNHPSSIYNMSNLGIQTQRQILERFFNIHSQLQFPLSFVILCSMQELLA